MDMAFKKKNAEAEMPEMTPEEMPAEENQAAPETEAEAPAQEESALEKAQAQAEEYLNMAQRVQADFDNYRRRTKATRAEAYEDGAREVIKQLLPVVDNLERAIAQAKEFGHSSRREVGYLTIHSMLHLLGYDHLDEGAQKAQMRGREEAIASSIPRMQRD